ncbi:MAG: hypothetical protein J6Q17_04050 [Clostridia bacterium]|nr:hypothetical protein [Clostridia bacterium]
MARCANCGCEIPNDDKTRLCDNCKKVILPFIKFMEASTTPAVKRLLSNERNLRNAGVTDRGMDYLYRICELHDKRRQAELDEKAARMPVGQESVPAEIPSDPAARQTVPPPAPEPVYPEGAGAEPEEAGNPGGALPAAKWVLILAGTAELAWFVARILTRNAAGESLSGSIDVTALSAALGSYAGAYAVGVLRKFLSGNRR